MGTDGTGTPAVAARQRLHLMRRGGGLAGCAQLTFFVRKNDFNTPILRSTTFRGVYIHRVFVAIAFNLNPFFVDTQVNQHVSNGLRTVA